MPDLSYANIKSPMPPDRIRQDMTRARRNGDVILLVEIEKVSYGIFSEVFPQERYHRFLGHDMAAALDRTVWPVAEIEWDFLHDGRSGVCPDRWLGTVHAQDADGANCDHLWTHMVAHAWCRHNKPHKEWRREKWEHGWDKIIRKAVCARLDATPLTLSLDANRVRMPQLHRFAREVGSRVGIDHQFVLNPIEGPKITPRRRARKYPLNSDHPGKALPFDLRGYQ
jgi:hypothetical protein